MVEARGPSARSAGDPPGLLADVAELLGGESARSRRFLGGLIVGALVGAALAGGSLRRRRAPVPDRAPHPSARPPDPVS
jgi:hypothetical protein